jgi:GNAT superfamily N-acetyltransferase
VKGGASDDPVDLRSLDDADIEPLAELWTHAWHDAHAGVVPAELTRLRTRESFRDRLVAARSRCQAIGPTGAPTGFVRFEGSELDQFYVHPAARGTGLAKRLMVSAEAAMRAGGTRRAWLACSVGNHRAARFYERCGWRNVGRQRFAVETSAGPFELDVWRFEKDL